MFAFGRFVASLLTLIFWLPLAFLRLAITEVKTTRLTQNVGQEGNIFDRGNIIELFNNLKANASPAFGNFTFSQVLSTLAADTYTGGNMVGGIIQRNSTGNTTDSVATATNIINAIPGAVVGQSFPMVVSNMGSGTLTIATNTGVTLQGTATIGRFASKLFLGTVTGSAAVTLQACFSFGASGTTGA